MAKFNGSDGPVIGSDGPAYDQLKSGHLWL